MSSRQLVQQQKTPNGCKCWWLLAERRRCQKTTSETGEQWSIRYWGASLCWHRYISIPGLYFTRCETSSQRPWSYFRVLLIMRAASFNTRCSLSVAFFGAPVKIALQYSTRNDTKAWTSVAAKSKSSDLRIRQSCQSLKIPAAQTLLTCLSRQTRWWLREHGHAR